MSELRHLVKLVLVSAVVVLFLVLAGASWWASNVLRDELLVPRHAAVVPDLDVLAVGSGRVVLSRSDLSATDGIFGLAGSMAYGQVSTVASAGEDRVERSLRDLDGAFVAGDRVAIDEYAFFGDPFEAHGMTFEEVVVRADAGFFPAWLVPNRGNTWAIFVHGRGVDERRQILRTLPVLRESGLSVLAITYSNDENAPASPSGLRSWGLAEWRDVEAAMEFATTQGAERFVLIGHSLGAEIVATVLHESDMVGLIDSVVLDSPVLSLEAVAEQALQARNVPALLRPLAKSLTALRYDVDWRRLDQVSRADEFDVPILIFHGTQDDFAPFEISQQMAEALPDLVTLEAVDSGHLFPWNRDPTRYEDVLLRFLAAHAAS